MRSSLILIVLLASCSNHSTKTVSTDTANQQTITNTASTTDSNDTSINTPLTDGTDLYVWQVNFENKTKTKNPRFKNLYLTVDTIIKGLNILYPKIQLDKVKVSGDTLYTAINDSYYLGESIGTYGANAYIADAVINLTSVKNIDFVKIDFEEGSHISPGTWSKKDFRNYAVQ